MFVLSQSGLYCPILGLSLDRNKKKINLDLNDLLGYVAGAPQSVQGPDSK